MTVISISTCVISSLKGREVSICRNTASSGMKNAHDSDASEGDDEDLSTSLFI